MRATYSASTEDAPHVLLPGLRWFSASVVGPEVPRRFVVVGQLDHLPSQQLQRPAGATFGLARTGGVVERASSLLVSTIGSCPRLLVQGWLRDYL